jgi:hypothetical protein
MTAQIPEKLRYEGDVVDMCANPLSDYFAVSGVKMLFQPKSTALWRGYVGLWEIIDDLLYLVELRGTLEGGTEASVGTFFPDFPDRVFAQWYSGTIRIRKGKRLEYAHMGYGSTSEQDLLLDVEHGVVKNTRGRHNGTAEVRARLKPTKSRP